MRIVAELHVHQFQPPLALDVDAVEAVDQDVGDGGVFEQVFQRSQAEGFVHDLVHEAFLVGAVEQTFFVEAEILDDAAHFPADHVGGHGFEILHVQAVDQLPVDAHFKLLEIGRPVLLGDGAECEIILHRRFGGCGDGGLGGRGGGWGEEFGPIDQVVIGRAAAAGSGAGVATGFAAALELPLVNSAMFSLS